MVLVLGFFLFYLINQPEGAANAVRTVFGAMARAFQSLVTFFTSLAVAVAGLPLARSGRRPVPAGKAGEYMVLEVRKHWAASLWPWIRLDRSAC